MTHHDLPIANTKAELLAQLAPARAALEKIIDGLNEEQLSAPGPEGWSVKDHLVHLAVWERKVLDVIQGKPAHESLGVPEDVYESTNEDELNDILHARDQHRPAAEVLADFRAARQAMQAAVENISEAKLAERYDPSDPNDNRRLIDAISGNSFQHDLEHAEWIGRLISGQ